MTIDAKMDKIHAVFTNLYVAGYVSGSRFLGLLTADYVNGYTNRGKSDIILAKLDKQ